MQSSDTLKAAEEQGLAVNAIAMEREIQQGKNIVDAAAATVSTLERLILSTLSHARKWSGGKITHNLHFDGKAQFTDYARTTYPELWAKTSQLQMGMFASNLKMGIPAIEKVGEKDYKLLVPMGDDRRFPMVDTNSDTGRPLSSRPCIPTYALTLSLSFSLFRCPRSRSPLRTPRAESGGRGLVPLLGRVV